MSPVKNIEAWDLLYREQYSHVGSDLGFVGRKSPNWGRKIHFITVPRMQNIRWGTYDGGGWQMKRM